MIDLHEELEVGAPLAEVWRLLQDPALVASCIPGVGIDGEEPPGTYQGRMTFKFGPTVAVFRGEATVRYDADALTCGIEGRGTDQRGASRALASFLVSAEGGETTRLRVRGGFKVSGPLDASANAGGRVGARVLLAGCAAILAALAVGPAAGPAEPQPATPAGQPAPVAANGFAVLWKAVAAQVVAWLRRLAAPRGPHSN